VSVYVDEPRSALGRMIMCHMIADSTAELLRMAHHIGVDRRWLQYEGSYREHFDVCKSKRTIAVQAGAIEVTQRELAQKLRTRREVLK
jgi:Protein of unknown function (DUF4031)